MDLGFLVLLALLWGFIQMVNSAQKRARGTGTGGPPAQRPARSQRTPGRPPGTFEELLEQMRGQLEQGKAGGARVTLPGAEEVEDRESLEIVPVVVSRELPAPAQSRKVVDFDDEAETLIRRRIAQAEARNHALTAADHRAFDKRIRREPVKTIAPAHPRNLRQALIWKEVLGKPVTLRDEG